MAVSDSLMHNAYYAPQDEYFSPNRQQPTENRFPRAMYDYPTPYQNPLENTNKREESTDGTMLDLLPSDVIHGLDGLSLDSLPVYDHQLTPQNYANNLSQMNLVNVNNLSGMNSVNTLLLNQIRGYQFPPAMTPQLQSPPSLPPPSIVPNMGSPSLQPPPTALPTMGHMSPTSPADKSVSPSEKDGNYRCTWSQTRRVRNLNRPMIPISIKIPLHEKHLWWESPTVTLNMFAPYSTQLVKGEKTIETRNYQLPNKCKGVRIGIVEIMPKGLPSKKPELVGEVVFVDCKEYTSREEWEADAPYHKIDVNHEMFGWKKNRKKYGWVVHTWQSYDRTIREAASDYCNTRIHYTKNFFVWAYV